MDDGSQLTEFGKVFLYILLGTFLVLFTMLLGKIIAPKKPNTTKLSSYECGEVPVGNAWIQFNPRFYVVALVFLLFDVEMVFLFPWSTVFGQETLINADSRWGWFTMAEMFTFIAILLLGLLYIWKKGDLEWVRPKAIAPKISGGIPVSAYEKVNDRKYDRFATDLPVAEPVITAPASAGTAPVKTGFKPRFRPKNN